MRHTFSIVFAVALIVTARGRMRAPERRTSPEAPPIATSVPGRTSDGEGAMMAQPRGHVAGFLHGGRWT